MKKLRQITLYFLALTVVYLTTLIRSPTEQKRGAYDRERYT
jgi:hypothetical protein